MKTVLFILVWLAFAIVAKALAFSGDVVLEPTMEPTQGEIAAAGGGGPDVDFFDDFERANGPIGNDWNAFGGSDLTLSGISGGRINSGSGTGGTYTRPDVLTGKKQFDLAAEIFVFSSGDGGFHFFPNESQLGTEMGANGPAGTSSEPMQDGISIRTNGLTVTYDKIVGGVITNPAGGAVAITQGILRCKVDIQATLTNVRVWSNGVLVIDNDDASPDRIQTVAHAGFWTSGFFSDNCRFDDFSMIVEDVIQEVLVGFNGSASSTPGDTSSTVGVSMIVQTSDFANTVRPASIGIFDLATGSAIDGVDYDSLPPTSTTFAADTPDITIQNIDAIQALGANNPDPRVVNIGVQNPGRYCALGAITQHDISIINIVP